MAVTVRRRTAEDLEALATLLVQVHQRDGYPHQLPADPRGFLTVADQLGAWVAQTAVAGRLAVIGHVVLRTRGPDPVMEMAEAATGLDDGQLAVVSRLFVGTAGRGTGAGRALLDGAAGDAERLGRVAVLDVTVDLAAANALYQRAGWRRIGQTDVEFPDGSVLHQFVYVAPGAPNPSHQTDGSGPLAPQPSGEGG